MSRLLAAGLVQSFSVIFRRPESSSTAPTVASRKESRQVSFLCRIVPSPVQRNAPPRSPASGAVHRKWLDDPHRARNLLTRKDLQNPEKLREATGWLADYRPECTYERCARVSLAALPFHGASTQKVLDRLFPGWDESRDGSFSSERRSFLYLFLSASSLILLVFVRAILAWWQTVTCMFRASTCLRIWAAPDLVS